MSQLGLGLLGFGLLPQKITIDGDDHTLRKIVCEYFNFSVLCLILFVILFQLSVNRGLFAT
jgi:hypothetical protein